MGLYNQEECKSGILHAQRKWNTRRMAHWRSWSTRDEYTVIFSHLKTILYILCVDLKYDNDDNKFKANDSLQNHGLSELKVNERCVW